MSIDLLVIGPHPDDLEIGLAGTIARHVADGHRVGLCDLTAGELGSNGTPETRRAEALEAAAVLGAVWRENLGWPDGGITPDHVRPAAELIRRHRPSVVAVPYWDDRHPDHVAASRVLQEGVFRSGLRRYAAAGDAWRVDWICYYFINNATTPSFVIDVSDHYATKRAALACHRSQFAPAGPDAVPTRLTASSFQQLIESRDSQFGAQIGASFAEGVIVREPIERRSLFRTPS
ncbi:MAG: bacillithiol biosynthesis deacetylase BshB1 [Acidobacteria bacterium SCN 69-37]|nr:MAG: bacillithiol biosynthesis deacetylase BshB1 [Acidobacteria bacterium SCN 69-37]